MISTTVVSATASIGRRHGISAPVDVSTPVPGQHVRLRGRIDAGSVAEVRLALHAAVDHGNGALYVDVSELHLGDATGLGALLGTHRRARRCGREVVLVDADPTLRRLLAYTRLLRVFRLITAADLAAAAGLTAVAMPA